MEKRTIEITRAFIAKSADGREFLIHEYTEFREGISYTGPYRLPYAPQLRTADGRAVTRIEKGKYEIHDFDSTIVVTSDDPQAP
jgi:hypothetical protein